MAAQLPSHLRKRVAQSWWRVDAQGRSLVNEIIRLEDLEATWPRLQKRVCGLRHVKYAEMHEINPNPSTHGHYSEYYDDHTRKLVGAYAGPDLARYGYTYEAKKKRKSK